MMLRSRNFFCEDILRLFVGKNSKLYVLSSLKLFVTTVRDMILHVSPIFLFLLFLNQFDGFLCPLVNIIMINYLYILTIRPSVERKDLGYYIRYTQQIVVLIFFIQLLFWITIRQFPATLAPIYNAIPKANNVLFTPVIPVIFSILFYLDTFPSWKNMINSIKNALLLSWRILPGLAVFITMDCAFKLITNTISTPIPATTHLCGIIMSGSFINTILIIGHQLYLILYLSLLMNFYIQVRYNYPEIFHQ